MPNSVKIRDAVLKVVTSAMHNANREAPLILDDDHLGDTLSLSSLDFAVIVVNLEEELGVDPFRSASPRVQTFGQLVQLYERASMNLSHED